MERLTLTKTKGFENHRRRTKASKGRLQHVEPRKNRQKQPILGHIKAERHETNTTQPAKTKTALSIFISKTSFQKEPLSPLS